MPPFESDPTRYPSGPGCYLMLDAAGTVMYVGKAKNLRRRLSSHFRPLPPQAGRRSRLLAALAEIELVLVSNETEALILENNLIKLHKPAANRVLLDADEGYFYIALTAEDLPRLVAYRKNRINKELERGGAVTPVARCFGPYVNRRFRDALLGFVVDQFQMRTCAPLPSEVCLRYHLGACGGVCERRLSVTEYSRAVADAVGFLSHQHGELIRHMKRQMAAYAAQLRFEQASWIKRHIELLEGALESQVVERDVRHDQDVVHVEADTVMVLQVRSGMVCGCTLCDLAGASRDGFLLDRYSGGCPAELIVNQVEDPRSLEQQLTGATGRRVRVTHARSGPEAAHRLMRLCSLNHQYRAAQRVAATCPACTSLPSVTVTSRRAPEEV
jgi:excinuclease ABC subunit C